MTLTGVESRDPFGFSGPKLDFLFQEYRCCRDSRPFIVAVPHPPFAFPVTTVNSPFNMSLTSQAAARCCRQLVRPSLRISSTTYLSQRTPSRRWNSTDAQAAAPANPKITQIVDQISQLTLLETADLVASLKVGFLCVLVLSKFGPPFGDWRLMRTEHLLFLY